MNAPNKPLCEVVSLPHGLRAIYVSRAVSDAQRATQRQQEAEQPKESPR
jgi:hypothetical protein